MTELSPTATTTVSYPKELTRKRRKVAVKRPQSRSKPSEQAAGNATVGSSLPKNVRVIFSTAVPPGHSKAGGPFRVLNEIHRALEDRYRDEMTVLSGEGMPGEPMSLAAGLEFDELMSFEIEKLPVEWTPRYYIGNRFDNLEQERIITRLFPECKKIGMHFSCHPLYALEVLRPEYVRIYGEQNAKDYPPKFTQLYRTQLETRYEDAVIVASRFAASTYEKHTPGNKKILVVPFGVDSDIFHPASQIPGFSVLFAGGNAVRKGISYLLVGWNIFVQSLSPAHRQRVQLGLMGTQQIQKVPERVVNYGWWAEEQVPEMFAKHQIFVLPSLEEGMALANLEAMASGCPIITTEESGITSLEGFKNNVHGFIIPSRDSRAIAERIRFFYEHPEEIRRMGNEARKLAEEHPWSRFRTEFVKAVESV